MPDTEIFLVDPRLKVATAGGLLKRRPPIDLPPPTVTPGGKDEPAIALCQDGSIVPGGIYPSSRDDGGLFYLPSYALRVVDGRYTTNLHFRSANEDPNGPLARLN